MCTKRIKGYSSLTYEQRLAKLNLGTISYRRLYYDMLLVYKSLNGYTYIAPSSLGLELSNISSRRSGFRLNHLKPKSEAMVGNFCFRAPREWNSIPGNCNKCVSIAGFKSAFRKYFKNCIWLLNFFFILWLCRVALIYAWYLLNKVSYYYYYQVLAYTYTPSTSNKYIKYYKVN